MVLQPSLWRWLTHLSPRLKLGLASLLLLLVLIPGQNDYQRLWPHPQALPVKRNPLELPPPTQYPVFAGVEAPYLTAQAVIVVDSDSAVVLYEKNAQVPLFPASTTKIMTALVALEAYPLDEVITVKQASESIGHEMRLVPGERISVKNLLYGALVESGNDAALALAQHYPGGYQDFIDRMNQKAKEFNLENTQFRNVSGVEQAGHVTTVRDLAILAKEALKNETFAEIVGTEVVTLQSEDGEITHTLRNINELLGTVPGVKGVKTGWTENAGECLVTVTERDGHTIITVVLGSEDRFGESKKLIDWAFANHRWEKIEEMSNE